MYLINLENSFIKRWPHLHRCTFALRFLITSVHLQLLLSSISSDLTSHHSLLVWSKSTYPGGWWERPRLYKTIKRGRILIPGYYDCGSSCASWISIPYIGVGNTDTEYMRRVISWWVCVYTECKLRLHSVGNLSDLSAVIAWFLLCFVNDNWMAVRGVVFRTIAIWLTVG